MTDMQAGIEARTAAFRRLHASGCFVIPNPWDVGTARFLASLGFHALATTSAGMAFSAGLPDEAAPTDAGAAAHRDMALAHVADLVRATELPLNADFQSGFASDAAGVGENVRLCVLTGVAGLSIEDSTGDAARPLFDLPVAVERMQAARAAIDATRPGVLLTSRAECFLVGHPDPLRESIARLEAYAAAGADVLFAPGVRTRDDIGTIVRAVAPKPVNVLVSTSTGMTVTDYASLGVRRISVGSALSRVAWGAFAKAARAIAGDGSFEAFADAMPFTEINALFRTGS